MSYALRETFIVLLSLLFFVEGRSIKDCCPKLDPDAFRNVVSNYILLLFLSVSSIRRFSLAVCVSVSLLKLHSTNQLISLRCQFILYYVYRPTLVILCIRCSWNTM